MWGGLSSARALPPGSRSILLGILTVALILRLALFWMLPNIHQADEVYQVAEQAHRSLHGYGIVSWEFQTAARAAILPTLVKPIYALPLSAGARQSLTAALFSILSLLPIWAAFEWAGRLHGLRGAAIAAAMMATWFELVYFAPKATADVVSGYFFLAALFLARPGASRGSVVLGAAALALALGIRVQIAPAVGLAVVAVALVREPGRMRAIAAGLGAGLALVGVIEWLWWGAPFQGQWGYLAAEFAHGASTFFSREPVTFFVKNYVLTYGGLLPLVALLVWAGARQAPILLVAFLALVLPFHVVGHKEYRFVMVAAPVLVLLMGLGAADLWARFGSRARWGTALVALAGWLVAMTAMSLSDTFRPFWTTDRNRILAFRDIAEQPDACGVALVSMRWWHTPGYSGLGRDIPIYEILSADEEAQLLGAANYLLAGPKAPPPPPPWTQWRAYSRPVEYAYRRPGGCQPVPAAKVERPPLLPGLGP